LERTGIDRNFLLSQKNPEIKVSRHCRGHARLKYIVGESSLVMEQRGVVRFLIFKKLAARDITAELEGMYGHEALSPSTNAILNGSTFNDGERGLVSGHFFRGAFSGRAPCQRDKL
jgi:hypothetical protein